MKELLESMKFNIIHVHDSHSLNYSIISDIKFGLKTNFVMSRRVDFPVEGVLSRWKYNYSGLKRIICVSKGVREIIAIDIKDISRLSIVHDGVELVELDDDFEFNIRKELSLKENTPLIGNVAALAPHKDYQTFVLTANEILKKLSDAHFLIVGRDDGELVKIKKLITKLDVKNIHILGFRSNAKSILRQLNVLLYTSKTEGLGTTLLDAMIRKIPIVATNAGGIPEVVVNDKSGLLSDVGDYKKLAKDVIRVLSEPELTEELTSTAAESVQYFSNHRMVNETLSIYNEVIKG